MGGEACPTGRARESVGTDFALDPNMGDRTAERSIQKTSPDVVGFF